MLNLQNVLSQSGCGEPYKLSMSQPKPSTFLKTHEQNTEHASSFYDGWTQECKGQFQSNGNKSKGEDDPDMYVYIQVCTIPTNTQGISKKTGQGTKRQINVHVHNICTCQLDSRAKNKPGLPQRLQNYGQIYEKSGRNMMNVSTFCFDLELICYSRSTTQLLDNLRKEGSKTSPSQQALAKTPRCPIHRRGIVF